jgi:hypothetical protein
LFLAAAAIITLLAVLLVGAQTASAQQGVTWELGNFCVEDYRPGAVCTAEDVRIADISPALTDVCLTVNDTATAYFTLDIVTGAQTRYDIGLFVSTDGSVGGAKSGDSCYHDFLQPPAALNTDGTPLNPLGVGPFANYDGDTCADTKQSTAALYKTQALVTIACKDNDNNGVVDPISTCTSWDNNAADVCSNVKNAFPGTNSKCNCGLATPNPPILLYKGIDGGDLPNSYGTLFSNPSNGARHAIQDPTGTGSPKTQAGQVAIWLGNSVDYAWTNPADETTAGGFPDPDALGDDSNNTDDENGVALLAPWYGGANGGKLRVFVNASAAGECTVSNTCTVAFWMDWDDSGAFNNTLFSSGGERYEFTLTNGTGVSYDLVFDTPATWNFNQLATRVRLYDNSSATPISPLGVVTNGEVEDYLSPIGTLAVTLNDFSAVCDAETPVISWSSVSEADTQGYNILRGLTPAGWNTQLNAALIPAQYPGSAQGGFYEWQDTTAQSGAEYSYWVQDVALSGATGLNGPISVTCMAPTAVGLNSLDAGGPAASSLTWWAVALAMAVLVAGVTVWQRWAKAR